MAALTKFRDTEQRAGTPIPVRGELGVEAATKIFQGSLVVKNAAGFMEPATAAAAKVALGRALRTYDNSAGAAGDIIGEFESGVFKWANKGGDLLTDAAHLGLPAHIEDDQTVRLTAAATSPAGSVWKVDADGVWVLTIHGVTT